MSGIWGKVVGGATGMMFGGPFGAFIGASMGHIFHDREGAPFAHLRAFNPLSYLPGGAAWRQFREQSRQSAFALAVVVLAGKMARADGAATPEEIAAFERLFAVPDKDREAVRVLFEQARGGAGGHAAFARGIGLLFKDSPQVLEELLDALFLVATADAPLSPAEAAFLAEVTELFGLPPRDWARVRAGRSGARAASGPDPYQVLGVARDAGEAEIRAAYRRLLRDHHPDVLMAQGLPQEFVEVANQKMAAINAAYDDIAQRRGFRK